MNLKKYLTSYNIFTALSTLVVLVLLALVMRKGVKERRFGVVGAGCPGFPSSEHVGGPVIKTVGKPFDPINGKCPDGMLCGKKCIKVDPAEFKYLDHGEPIERLKELYHPYVCCNGLNDTECLKRTISYLNVDPLNEHCPDGTACNKKCFIQDWTVTQRPYITANVPCGTWKCLGP